MSNAVYATGANPAFIGVLDGQPIVGLEPNALQRIAGCERKLSTRDLAGALTGSASGGTTVAATLHVAYRAGLTVAVTGGIGGVHVTLGPPDISADLLELARTPLVLICSGAKAILDIPATVEQLETQGVTVVGYQTNEFPAFWSAESGLPIDLTVQSAEEVAELWRAARAMGVPGAILVCVPPPAETALTREESEAAVARALAAARAQGIEGALVTPFLLEQVVDYTDGRSLAANAALLENNARVAGEIAVHVG
jgi:pseudouridine-5'-phosphate glycosidase